MAPVPRLRPRPTGQLQSVARRVGNPPEPTSAPAIGAPTAELRGVQSSSPAKSFEPAADRCHRRRQACASACESRLLVSPWSCLLLQGIAKDRSVDTAELGRCHAPIKSRRPVLCVRRAANQPKSHDYRVGHLLSEPDPPDRAQDGDTHPLISVAAASRTRSASPRAESRSGILGISWLSDPAAALC